MTKTLKDKFKIIETIFEPYIQVNNMPLDDLRERFYTKAYYVSKVKCKTGLVTKTDLQYINEKIKKLVEVLGTDESKIDANYIQNKLSYYPKDYWLIAYKKLLKIINNE